MLIQECGIWAPDKTSHFSDYVWAVTASLLWGFGRVGPDGATQIRSTTRQSVPEGTVSSREVHFKTLGGILWDTPYNTLGLIKEIKGYLRQPFHRNKSYVTINVLLQDNTNQNRYHHKTLNG